MRVRARVTTAAAGLALALTASLTSCVTVHGEHAMLPAITQEEAAEVLSHYGEVSNEANPVYDAELNRTIDTGTLGAINQAGHRSRAEVHPDGNANYTPLDFTDANFSIPRQAGWPKYFLADADSGRSDRRWLLLFTRSGMEQEWRASYLALLLPEMIPEISVDKDGYAQAVTGGDDPGTVLAPAELSAAYAGFLSGADEPFAEGPYTTGIREARAETDLAFVVQYQDLAVDETSHAPVGLRTTDGRALVFFSSHHHEKQTWAPGETPVVDQYVEALMEGTVGQSVTTERMAMQLALVPAEGEGDIEILTRIPGVITARGA